MKFPLAILTVVVSILSSSLLVTAQLGDSEKSANVSTIAERTNFTITGPKGTKGDRGPEFHTSCKELYKWNLAVPSGYYNITTPQGVERVYCEMNTANCGNITGGWMRIARIDAKNETYSCAKWQLRHTLANPCPSFLCPTVSFCTRSQTQTETNGCFSIKFPTFGVPYNKVCGRARGYQYGFTRAFYSYAYARQRTLDDSYVSGLSVTHPDPGKPGKREHIWTFAAGYSKAYGYATVNCPCAQYPGPHPPPFVGDNYFCDSGNPDNSYFKWHVQSGLRLWNSEGCDYGRQDKCCKHRGAWFTTDVSLVDEKESDYIEMRICRFPPDTRIEDIGVDELEIYITKN